VYNDVHENDRLKKIAEEMWKLCKAMSWIMFGLKEITEQCVSYGKQCYGYYSTQNKIIDGLCK
jgi:hypothetical protein